MKEKIKALWGKILLFLTRDQNYRVTKWLSVDIDFCQFGAGFVTQIYPRTQITIAVAVWFLTIAFIIPIHKQ